jgi:alkanesulfonate monooxygenase SsuD/methylene tetrahydromethanopterin reductase-like flavin-dependent oxidoreductase (luciferase family)
VHFGLQFDFRNPPSGGTSMAERYEVGLEMAAWAEAQGAQLLTVSEHHGQTDGYLPSPLLLLAGMAARTSSIRLMVTALIAPFYEPLRLAEDLLVLDNLSAGRVDLVVAGGYVTEEFELFGISSSERGARVTEVVTTLKAAFTGEPFEYRGRTVTLTPPPCQPGGPRVLMGGSSRVAAERAARLADGFFPTDEKWWPSYRDELARLGKPDPGPFSIGAFGTVAFAEDPVAGWEEMAPYFLHEHNAYASLQQASENGRAVRPVADLEELARLGTYRVLSPEAYVAEQRESGRSFQMLTPLCGGMPPEHAWESLRLFGEVVLPALR